MQVNFGMKGPQADAEFQWRTTADSEVHRGGKYRPEGDGVAFDWIATQPGEFRTSYGSGKPKLVGANEQTWIEHINSLGGSGGSMGT